jgi:hypothetical protein
LSPCHRFSSGSSEKSIVGIQGNSKVINPKFPALSVFNGFRPEFHRPPCLGAFPGKSGQRYFRQIDRPHGPAPFPGSAYALQDWFTVEFPSEISTFNSRQESKSPIF